MHKRIKTILVCPKCKNTLDYAQGFKEIFCIKDQLSFPVRNGVPILLESEAKPTGVALDDTATSQKQMPAVELIE